MIQQELSPTEKYLQILAAVDNFYNRGNITTTSSFTTKNEEIDSFVGDGGNILEVLQLQYR